MSHVNNEIIINAENIIYQFQNEILKKLYRNLKISSGFKFWDANSQMHLVNYDIQQFMERVNYKGFELKTYFEIKEIQINIDQNNPNQRSGVTRESNIFNPKGIVIKNITDLVLLYKLMIKYHLFIPKLTIDEMRFDTPETPNVINKFKEYFKERQNLFEHTPQLAGTKYSKYYFTKIVNFFLMFSPVNIKHKTRESIIDAYVYGIYSDEKDWLSIIKTVTQFMTGLVFGLAFIIPVLIATGIKIFYNYELEFKDACQKFEAKFKVIEEDTNVIQINHQHQMQDFDRVTLSDVIIHKKIYENTAKEFEKIDGEDKYIIDEKETTTLPLSVLPIDVMDNITSFLSSESRTLKKLLSEKKNQFTIVEAIHEKKQKGQRSI